MDGEQKMYIDFMIIVYHIVPVSYYLVNVLQFKPMLRKVKEKQDHSGLVNNEMSTLSMLDKNLNKLKDVCKDLAIS